MSADQTFAAIIRASWTPGEHAVLQTAAEERFAQLEYARRPLVDRIRDATGEEDDGA